MKLDKENSNFFISLWKNSNFFFSLTTSKIIIRVTTFEIFTLSFETFRTFTKFSRNFYKFPMNLGESYLNFVFKYFEYFEKYFSSDKKLQINLDWTHLNILTNSSLRHLTNYVPCSYTWDTPKPEEHSHYHRPLSQTRPYIRLYLHNPRTSLKIRLFANWKRFHYHRPPRWWNQQIFQTHTRFTSTTT